MSLQHTTLSKEDQTKLAISLKEKYSSREMERLMRSFAKFINMMAYNFCKKKHHNPSLVEDYVSVGNMALFKAVQKYDSSKCSVFNVYAAKWIRAEMNMHYISFRTPVSMSYKTYYKLIKNFNDANKEGASPSSNVIMDFPSQIDDEELIEGNEISQERFSLARQLFDLNNKFMSSLTERDKVIWNDYMTGEPNNADVGRILQLTRERVRQIQSDLVSSFKKFVSKSI